MSSATSSEVLQHLCDVLLASFGIDPRRWRVGLLTLPGRPRVSQCKINVCGLSECLSAAPILSRSTILCNIRYLNGHYGLSRWSLVLPISGGLWACTEVNSYIIQYCLCTFQTKPPIIRPSPPLPENGVISLQFLQETTYRAETHEYGGVLRIV